jgi:hypothetical protein
MFVGDERCGVLICKCSPVRFLWFEAAGYRFRFERICHDNGFLGTLSVAWFLLCARLLNCEHRQTALRSG